MAANVALYVATLVATHLYALAFLARACLKLNPRRREAAASAPTAAAAPIAAAEAAATLATAAPAPSKGSQVVLRRLTATMRPLHLEWRGLGCWYRAGGGRERAVLQSVYGGAAPASLTALMGPSGAGKSTLLDILAGRKRTGRLEGAVIANGALVWCGGSSSSSSSGGGSSGGGSGGAGVAGAAAAAARPAAKLASAYVPQADAFLPTMTADETAALHAALMLPHWGARRRAERAAQVLAAMGLARAEGTLVGGCLPGGLSVRGLSGGERKRLAIGVGLMATPAAVFLDEPTSGLDAYAALSVVRYLRAMAHRGGHTVVASIHQPRAAIWALFDAVTVLSAGLLMYHGPRSGLVPWFESLGHRFDAAAHGVPSDWAMDLVNTGFARGAGDGADDADDEAAGGAPPQRGMRTAAELRAASEAFLAAAGYCGRGGVTSGAVSGGGGAGATVQALAQPAAAAAAAAVNGCGAGGKGERGSGGGGGGDVETGGGGHGGNGAHGGGEDGSDNDDVLTPLPSETSGVPRRPSVPLVATQHLPTLAPPPALAAGAAASAAAALPPERAAAFYAVIDGHTAAAASAAAATAAPTSAAAQRFLGCCGGRAASDGDSRRPGFLRQFCVLAWRELLAVTRNPADVAGRALVFGWVGLLVGLVYYDLGASLPALRSRLNLLYVEPNIYLLLPYVYMSLYTADKAQFVADTAAGLFRPRAYAAAKAAAALPFSVLNVLAFALTVYGMAGLRPAAAAAAANCGLSVLLYLVAAQVLALCSTLAANQDGAFFCAIFWTACNLLLSNFLVRFSDMKLGWLSQLRYLSAMGYAFEGFAAAEFGGGAAFPCGEGLGREAVDALPALLPATPAVTAPYVRSELLNPGPDCRVELSALLEYFGLARTPLAVAGILALYLIVLHGLTLAALAWLARGERR